MKQFDKDMRCEVAWCEDAAEFVFKLHRRDEPLLGGTQLALCPDCAVEAFRSGINAMQEDEQAAGITLMLL